jgi:hypothetical protein
MAFKGIFASDNGGIGDRVGEFSKVVSKVGYGGTAPMLALSAGMRREKTHDPVFNWMEENANYGLMKILSDSEDCCGPIIFEDASMVVVGQVYLALVSGERLHVTGVHGNQVTARRGVGGTPVYSLPAGSELQRIGTAFEEGSDAPVPFSLMAFPRFNYTQIFRNSWGATGTAQATSFHSHNSRYAKDRRSAIGYHATDIETSMIWGVKEIGRQNNMPFRMSDGLNNQIMTNKWVAPFEGLSEDMMNKFIETIFERNIEGQPNERIAFGGNAVITVLNKLVRECSTYNISANEKVYGINVTRWNTPHGDLSLMTHPMMNTNRHWKSDLYVYHPGAIKTRWLRETMYDESNKSGSRQGVDADRGAMTTELGFQLMNEIVHGRFHGICKADTRKDCNECRPNPCCPSSPNCGC